ncbi:MAG: GGDEF domain-containing protein [Gammaproteobacteria bacterium]|nr:GGDEF domain-containing protein [Gammaproteobacteria bacterium]
MMTITKSHTNYIYMNSIFFWLVLSLGAGMYLLMTNQVKLLHIAALSGTGLILGLLTASLFLLIIDLQKENERDPLTQAFSRSYYRKKLKSWCENKVNFSLILIDVDYFNSINTVYGYSVGDEVLISLSELIMNNTKRTHDIVARHGDGKFALMVDRNDLVAASNIAKRLCIKISRTPMHSTIHLTCSFGVAQFRTEGDTPDTLFERANDALMKSKDNGKNCVAMEVAA